MDNNDDENKRKPCKPVTLEMAREFHKLSRRGWFQSRIAARFDVNQGRVSEVLSGKKFPDSGSNDQGSLFD